MCPHVQIQPEGKSGTQTHFLTHRGGGGGSAVKTGKKKEKAAMASE